jgi:hypothetical protein
MAENQREKIRTLFDRWRAQRRPGCLGSSLMDPKPIPPPWRGQLIAMILAWLAVTGLIVGIIWLVGTGP